MSSLLVVAITSLLIPTAFHAALGTTDVSLNGIQKISRGTSVILLVVYLTYFPIIKRNLISGIFVSNYGHTHTCTMSQRRKMGKNYRRKKPGGPAACTIPSLNDTKRSRLVISSALIAVCAEFLVDSIDGMVDRSGLSPAFVGLILLPIVGNVAEVSPSSIVLTSQHITAVRQGMKDKMGLAIGVAVGSSMQIALFVIPLMVLLGWGIHVDMSLFFDTFETCALFITVLYYFQLEFD